MGRNSSWERLHNLEEKKKHIPLKRFAGASKFPSVSLDCSPLLIKLFSYFLKKAGRSMILWLSWFRYFQPYLMPKTCVSCKLQLNLISELSKKKKLNLISVWSSRTNVGLCFAETRVSLLLSGMLFQIFFPSNKFSLVKIYDLGGT